MCNHMPVSIVERLPPGCCLIEILLRGFNRAPQFERLSVCGLGAIKSFPLHARVSLCLSFSLSYSQKCGSNRARLNLNSFVKCCSKFSTTLSKKHTHTDKLIWFIWPKTTHKVLPPGRRQHYILFFRLSLSFSFLFLILYACCLWAGIKVSGAEWWMGRTHTMPIPISSIMFMFIYIAGLLKLTALNFNVMSIEMDIAAAAAAAKKHLTLRIRNIRHPMALCTHNSFSFCITQKNTRRGCSISVCPLPYCKRGVLAVRCINHSPRFFRRPIHVLPALC